MENSLSALVYKGSIPEAILESKKQKKLFVVYISGKICSISNLISFVFPGLIAVWFFFLLNFCISFLVFRFRWKVNWIGKIHVDWSKSNQYRYILSVFSNLTSIFLNAISVSFVAGSYSVCCNQVAESLSKYCIFLRIPESSTDAANFCAICILCWLFLLFFKT